MKIDRFEEKLVPCSFNNKLMVEPYVKTELKSKEVNGFAFVSQKSNLQGLKVLMNAKLNDGFVVQKDSIIYIKEEVLHTQAWAQKQYECPSLKGKFLIVDLGFVEFIESVELTPIEAA